MYIIVIHIGYLLFDISNDSKMKVESIILDTEIFVIKSSILMALPLSKAEKLLGFKLLISGGGQ